MLHDSTITRAGAHTQGLEGERKRPTRGYRAGWTPLHPPGASKTCIEYQHASGWIVRHCGHPTANWPYYGVSADGSATLVVTHNGKGFKGLLAAMTQIEAHLAGELAMRREENSRYGYVWLLVPVEAGPSVEAVR